MLSTRDQQAATPRDEGLQRRWWEEQGRRYEALRQAEDETRKAAIETRKANWRRRWEDHINSPEWRALRVRVLERAGGLCEGCRQAPAVQVHHLTYKHLGNELLWELVAVCDACHERAHREVKHP
jgi:5-methylcytosine-specific restriction endonuclease McrA